MRRIVLAVLLVAVLAARWSRKTKAADVIKEMRKALGGDKLEIGQDAQPRGPVSARRRATADDGHHRADDSAARPACIAARKSSCPAACRWSASSHSTAPQAWDDQKQRGGMGGGMQIVMAGPRGARTQSGGDRRGAPPPHAQRADAISARVLRWRDAAADLGRDRRSARRQSRRARSEERRRRDVRLFVDQQTHLPLMLQYQEVRPRMMFDGGRPRSRRSRRRAGDPGWTRRRSGGRVRRRSRWRTGPAAGAAREGRGDRVSGPSPEEMHRRMEPMPPPAPSTVNLVPRRLQEGRRRHAPASADAVGRRQTGRGVDHREGQGQPFDQGRFLREEVERRTTEGRCRKHHDTCRLPRVLVDARRGRLARRHDAGIGAAAQSTLRIRVQDETQAALIHARRHDDGSGGRRATGARQRDRRGDVPVSCPARIRLKIEAEGFRGYTRVLQRQARQQQRRRHAAGRPRRRDLRQRTKRGDAAREGLHADAHPGRDRFAVGRSRRNGGAAATDGRTGRADFRRRLPRRPDSAEGSDRADPVPHQFVLGGVSRRRHGAGRDHHQAGHGQLARRLQLRLPRRIAERAQRLCDRARSRSSRGGSCSTSQGPLPRARPAWPSPPTATCPTTRARSRRRRRPA